MRLVCVDAGFLIGLYDDRDQHHAKAAHHFLQLFGKNNSNCLVVPWPILYETVSTRLVRNRKGMRGLQNDWSQLSRNKRLRLLPDNQYRTQVIQDCFDELGKPSGSYRALSASDRVVRNILADRKMQINAFVTFNRNDFLDVCIKFKRQLIC